MKNRLISAILLATIITLSGCAGSDFVRPAEGELTLGKSTVADVVKKMGNPYQTGEELKNEQRLKVYKYAYAIAGGESAYPDVTPTRAMVFTFFNDKLAGQEFSSSFKSDSTDFDSEKISSIVKGKTTWQEIISWLGRPSGEAIYPVIKNTNDRAYLYVYNQAKGSAFNLKFFSKILVVSFDEKGVVTDVEYTASGEQ